MKQIKALHHAIRLMVRHKEQKDKSIIVKLVYQIIHEEEGLAALRNLVDSFKNRSRRRRQRNRAMQETMIDLRQGRTWSIETSPLDASIEEKRRLPPFSVS
ncbi:unnamed protein product, partial [Musa hybrid cultivar]